MIRTDRLHKGRLLAKEKVSKRVKAHTRYYTEDGTLVPGVTTVLGILSKPALIPWANKLGLSGIDVGKYVDEKADIGTLAHALVTDKLSGIQTDTSIYSADVIDKAENCALSFWEWAKGKDISAIWVERPLVSEVHRFGGTADIYAVIDGTKELIDLKTGSGIYEEHEYQLAALMRLLGENNFEVERCRLLNIPRTEDERFVERVLSPQMIEDGWEIFLACLKIYNIKRKRK